MAPFDRKRILLFVKAPVAGTVKTRLADRFSPETILEIYKGFVSDFLGVLQTTGDDIRIFYDPPEGKGDILKWLGNRFPLHPQSGADLGKRMEAAFEETFAAGCAHAVLVGSDIPDLPVAILEEAFDALGRHPAVIGPSTDGGYYLIGFNSDGFLKEVFSGIPWSTHRVFADTINRFDRHHRPVHRLPRWGDIDTCEDLEDLGRRLRGQPDGLPNTRKLLKMIGLL